MGSQRAKKDEKPAVFTATSKPQSASPIVLRSRSRSRSPLRRDPGSRRHQAGRRLDGGSGWMLFDDQAFSIAPSVNSGTAKRCMGTITAFLAEKGYGFIKSPEVERSHGKDVWLHHKQLGGFTVGDTVTFSLYVKPDGSPQASELRSADQRHGEGKSESKRASEGQKPPTSAEFLKAGEGKSESKRTSNGLSGSGWMIFDQPGQKPRLVPARNATKRGSAGYSPSRYLEESTSVKDDCGDWV